ncbi:tetratricopeptide repeat protein [Amycolatopsis cihanbeyliensis]|uniref:Tetratricopeptide repeat protein n=1 Tax=Amycolatopsis cihanbeyliensis TaxID=1128664 RepID=A0A542DQP5_AMYCI|nr:tetratricopeptide repeat protein [Amycolatopsis cihanbeyliensis]TQJ05423.1 tetratricopeptide repeat protein [Amycolatopsis cihanbeyliensis]
MVDQEPAAEPHGESRFQAFRRAEELVRHAPLEALRALAPVLHAEPDKPSVQLLAGRAYFHSAQLRHAETALSRTIELDPADHYARFVLGRTLQRLGRLVEALGQMRMAWAMYPLPEYQEAVGEVSARLALSDG